MALQFPFDLVRLSPNIPVTSDTEINSRAINTRYLIIGSNQDVASAKEIKNFPIKVILGTTGHTQDALFELKLSSGTPLLYKQGYPNMLLISTVDNVSGEGMYAITSNAAEAEQYNAIRIDTSYNEDMYLSSTLRLKNPKLIPGTGITLSIGSEGLGFGGYQVITAGITIE